MGDVFLVYDETGKRYFRRLVYLNVIVYILFGILVVVNLVDFVVILLVAVLVAAVSFVYALYFIRKNPPIEPEESQ